MKSVRWLALELLLSALSIGVGWLIPDGLNLFAQFLGQEQLDVSPTDRLLAAMVTFAFTLSVQLLLFVRTEIRSARGEIPGIVKRVMEDGARVALENSLIRLMLGIKTAGTDTVSRVSEMLQKTVAPLADTPRYMHDAYLVIMERALAHANQEIRKAGSVGLEVDIADHVAITRRLAESAGSFMQIQRRAFKVPEEWTQEWMRFVSDLPRRGTACEYIVLMDSVSMRQQFSRLESMNRFLTDRGWTFSCCDLGHVLDSFGGALPTEWNLDVFNGRVIKVQETPAGRYQGGVRLRMTLLDVDDRPEFGRFVSCVASFAQPFPADLEPLPGAVRIEGEGDGQGVASMSA